MEKIVNRAPIQRHPLKMQVYKIESIDHPCKLSSLFRLHN